MTDCIASGTTAGIRKEQVVFEKPTLEEWYELLSLPWPRGQLRNAITILFFERNAPIRAEDVCWTPFRFADLNRFLRRHNAKFRLRVRKAEGLWEKYCMTSRPWSWDKEALLCRLVGEPNAYRVSDKRWPRTKSH